MEWLWNPQIVGIYNRLLQRCELNKHTTEAASGALQNITAGDRRVRAGVGQGDTWAGLTPTCSRCEREEEEGGRRRNLQGGVFPRSGRAC